MDADGTARGATRKEAQAEAARARICAAAVAALDQLGQAGASVGEIQARAGVSRGALTHHFPTKQALMAETARRLLAAALKPLRRPARPAAEEIEAAWRRIVDTPEGRALVEILIACRTDGELAAELAPHLRAWDAEVGAAVAARYDAPGGPQDAVLLWSIVRSFIRGLVLHRRFVDGEDELAAMVRRFAALVGPQLTPRGDETGRDR